VLRIPGRPRVSRRSRKSAPSLARTATRCWVAGSGKPGCLSRNW